MARNPLLAGLRPVHPGEILREDVLPALGLPKAEIARLLGISRQTLYEILHEKQPVTPAMALRVGKRRMWRKSELDEWAERQRAAQGRRKAKTARSA